MFLMDLMQENNESPPQYGRAPRCIVLAPTRELAKQVEKEFKTSAPSLKLGCYYGGKDFFIETFSPQSICEIMWP